MSLDPRILVYGLIFIAALLLVEGLVMLLGGRRKERRVRRRLLNRKADGTVALEELRRRGRDGADNAWAWLERIAPLRVVDRLLVQSGSTMTTTRFTLGMAAATLVLLAGLTALGRLPFTQTLLVSVGLGVGLPLLMLHIRSRRRVRRFGQQLPDAIDMVVRSLRAGHPINAAFQLVADQMPAPIGDEIGLVVDEMTYGLDLNEALDRLARRMEQGDLKFVVAAVKIQHRAGGNLAEILAGLCRVMREREKMLKKAMALSAEGRVSAIIVCALPMLVVGAIQVLNPGYYHKVMDHALFTPGVTFAALMMAAGVFTMWRMVSIKV